MRPLRAALSTLALACVVTPLANAQAYRAGTESHESKVDLYLGYGYFHPVNSDINYIPYRDVYNFPNGTLSLTYYLGRYLGVQGEIGYFSGNSPRGASGQCRAGACSARDQLIYTGEAGLVFRYPMGRVIPFMHALGGGARINGPYLQKLTTGWATTGGLGVDYVLPFWHDRLAVRPVQADFHYSQVDYGPLTNGGNEGGLGEIYALKLSAGAVLRFGGASEKVRQVELGCTTQPASVYPGEPVHANASIVNLKAGRQAFYKWTATSGRVDSTGDAATIDTSGLTPGEYTVAVHMSYGRHANEQANCTAPFSVRAYEPPVVSCSANPANVTSGAPVTITTQGISPQNRPLSYSYASTAGQIAGNGASATLSTAGLSPTTITVTCNIVDDLGKSASSTTQVRVESAPVPIVAESQALCSLSFDRDRARPSRVSNEAKACLDDIALNLNAHADAELYIIAGTAAGEPRTRAAERALNIRQYLVREKGISSGRILLRDGGPLGRLAHMELVPAGASYSDVDTRPVDENTAVHGEAYGRGAGYSSGRARTAPRRARRSARRSRATSTDLPPAP